jgi:peptidase E
MKSKFFLHGSGGHGFEYYRTLVDAVPTVGIQINVLVIPFAMDSFTAAFSTVKFVHGSFKWYNPHKEFSVTNALRYESVFLNSTPSKAKRIAFENALKEAHIVYVSGGDGDLLQYRVLRLISKERLKELASENKVITGGSAGANMWSTKYYSNDNQKIMEGLKVLPIATFCHYESEKWPQLNQLIKACPDLPVIPISNDGLVEL